MAIKSMDHVHLHMISNDLISESLKNKKHYNSFHPTLGFFLHLTDVLGWFDLPDEEFKKVSREDVRMSSSHSLIVII